VTYNWTPRGFSAESFDHESSHWQAEPFGNKGHVKLLLLDEYDAMTGNAVSENFYIPYPHRLVHFEAKHTDGDGAVNTTALTAAQFKVSKKWKTTASEDAQWHVLWDFSGVVASDFVHVFGDGYERPPSRYEITVNTTNGHRMYYEVIIQLLDKRGREHV